MKLRLLIIVLFTTLLGCKKWLDVKVNKSDVVPASLKDYRAMLDNTDILNSNYPFLGLISTDNFYVTDASWQASNELERYTYIWDKDIYHGVSSRLNWSFCYQQIAAANIVLEGLDKIGTYSATQNELAQLRSEALFYRAYIFYNLATLFAQPYDKNTVRDELGIPLRLNSDPNIKASRGNLEETYARILSDLTDAIGNLPDNPAYQTRPSKASAFGLLARVYLDMHEYEKAREYSSKALTLNSALIDFNTLNPSAPFPLPAFPNNKEISFYAATSNSALLRDKGIIDSTLYKSYSINDLRKGIFYKINAGLPYFKGSQLGNSSFFCGIANNEIYLINAEANARLGNTDGALQSLNTLLGKRWKTGTFQPIAATNAQDALVQILIERRKELPFTGSLRWGDLRRLNKEPQFAITLTRQVNNQIYLLPPNDPRYTLPIPIEEIRLSGIEQNPR